MHRSFIRTSYRDLMTSDLPVPAPIAPDTKDWTWVLRERCPECGFTASDVAPHALGATLRDLVPRWISALHRVDVRERPVPTVWSPLEYGAHVRDLLSVFAERLRLVLTRDDPVFPDWDQDAAALDGGYHRLDPSVVAEQLADGAESLAGVFDGVPDDAWERPGRRSDGSPFTTRTLGQYLLHDVVHHLHDVRA